MYKVQTRPRPGHGPTMAPHPTPTPGARGGGPIQQGIGIDMEGQWAAEPPLGTAGLYTSWHGMAWHGRRPPHTYTLRVPCCEQGFYRWDSLANVFVGGV
jgi:hypothetical protein